MVAACAVGGDAEADVVPPSAVPTASNPVRREPTWRQARRTLGDSDLYACRRQPQRDCAGKKVQRSGNPGCPGESELRNQEKPGGRSADARTSGVRNIERRSARRGPIGAARQSECRCRVSRAHRGGRQTDEHKDGGQPHDDEERTSAVVGVRECQHGRDAGHRDRDRERACGDCRLESGVRSQPLGGGQARGQGAADERAARETSHERGQHRRDSPDALADLLRQEPRPAHLVDERRTPGQRVGYEHRRSEFRIQKTYLTPSFTMRGARISCARPK